MVAITGTDSTVFFLRRTAPLIIGEIIVLEAASFTSGFVVALARNLRERIAEMNSGGPPR
jgi:hypothetical protein